MKEIVSIAYSLFVSLLVPGEDSFMVQAFFPASRNVVGD